MRDHFGQRPLYYRLTHDGSLLASDRPEPLVDWPGEPGGLDAEALTAQCLDYAPLLRERTRWNGVQRLPAAHILEWSAGRTRLVRYWHPGDGDRPEPGRDIVAQLRAEILEAVAAGLTTGVGAHVSGGLDSTAVAGVAASMLAAEGRSLSGAFSWSPPPDDSTLAQDERPRIGAAAGSVPVHWTDLAFDDVQAGMREALQPSHASGLLHERYVARAAQATGVRTVLSGYGGDEFASFHGRGAMPGALRSGALGSVLRHAVSARRQSGRSPGSAWVGSVKTAWVHGARPLWQRRPAAREPGSRADVLARTYGELHPSAPGMIDALLTHTAVSVDAARRLSYDFGHLEQRLGSWAHLADEHGYTYRYPLLTPRIAELAWSLTDRDHLRAPMARWHFRKAMEPYLPAELVWAPAKSEPAKFRRQLEVLAATPVVRPEGDSAAADIMEHFFHLRRRLHADWLALED